MRYGTVFTLAVVMQPMFFQLDDVAQPTCKHKKQRQKRRGLKIYRERQKIPVYFEVFYLIIFIARRK